VTRVVAAAVAVLLSGAPRLATPTAPESVPRCHCAGHAGRHECHCPMCHRAARAGRSLGDGASKAGTADPEKSPPEGADGLLAGCGEKDPRIAPRPGTDPYILPSAAELAAPAPRWPLASLPLPSRELPREPELPPPRRA